MQKQHPSEAILGIVIGFLILFVIFQAKWLMWTSLIIGLLGLFSTFAAEWITWAWGRLVAAIGYINSRVILGIIFAFILFPIALLYRLRNKDTLRLKKQSNTAFTEKNHLYTKKDLENPW